MIWLTGDYHFCHDREFVWKPRGFNSCEEMCEAIVQKHNEKVSKEDHIYILGDIMLGNNPEVGLSYLQRLNGFLHLVRGNHDSNKRWELYRLYSPATLSVVEQENALFLKYKKHTFFLSHYPTITANLEPEHLSQMVINIHSHTHQKTNFYKNAPFIYHCGLDSHNCEPVLLDDIIDEIHEQARLYNPGEIAMSFMQH